MPEFWIRDSDGRTTGSISRPDTDHYSPSDIDDVKLERLANVVFWGVGAIGFLAGGFYSLEKLSSDGDMMLLGVVVWFALWGGVTGFLAGTVASVLVLLFVYFVRHFWLIVLFCFAVPVIVGGVALLLLVLVNVRV